MQISATIVTLNEERNIARAIESLRCADEMVVVDSGSTDQTREIAMRLGARVIEEPWRGYAAQKNFAAQLRGARLDSLDRRRRSRYRQNWRRRFWR